MSINTKTPEILPFSINWGERVQVEVAFMTGIFRGKNGTEQRWRERINPRVKVSFSSSLMKRDAMLAALARLRSSHEEVFLVPDIRVFSEISWSPGTVTQEGLSMVYLQTGGGGSPLLQEKDNIILITPGKPKLRRTVSKIIAYDEWESMQIYLDEPVPEDYFGIPTKIASAVHATLQETISTDVLSSAVSKMSIQALSVPGRDSLEINSFSQVGKIAGAIMLPAEIRHNWKNSMSIDDDMQIEAVDWNTGLREQYAKELYPTRTLGIEVCVTNQMRAWKLREFIEFVSGRLKPFWAYDAFVDIPSAYATSSVYELVTGSDLNILLSAPVQGIVLTDEVATNRPAILIETTDGKAVMCSFSDTPTSETDLPLKIMGIFDSYTMMPSPDGVVITPETVKSIHRVRPYRLASDIVTFEYLSPHVCNVKLKLQELRDIAG